MPWLKGGWAGFMQLGNQGCRTCSLQLPNGCLEKIWSQTLATGTLHQVNFALKMLQNQTGNQRSRWMLIPGNTQNFIGHSPKKFHLLLKSALLWSGGWPRSTPQPRLLYDSKNWKDQCKFHSVADITDNCLLLYAVWLCSHPFRLFPYWQYYLLSLHYQWSRLCKHSATDLSKA